MKNAESFQYTLVETASTIRPSATSLSATIAPRVVPQVAPTRRADVSKRAAHEAAALAQVRATTARHGRLPHLFDEVGGVRRGRVGVTVVADVGVDVEVVEEDEGLRKRVRIG